MTDLRIQSGWTSQSKYHIDFARGAVYHSKATTRGQLNRIFKEQSTTGSFHHLSYFQMTDFWRKNKIAQFYLAFIRTLSVLEIGKLTNQATPGYINQHKRVFDRAYNTLGHPIAQNADIGFIRSPLDRQKLVDYMSKLVRESINYGQTRVHYESDKETSAKVTDLLRTIAFAAPKETVQAQQ